MAIFCNNFLSCVFGKHLWKWQKKHKLICELATISDEAFALPVLENIGDEWKDMTVVEFFSRHKGIEKDTKKGTKRRKIGGGHWTSDANGGTKLGGMLREWNNLMSFVNKSKNK